jgi:hypothetical protein
MNLLPLLILLLTLTGCASSISDRDWLGAQERWDFEYKETRVPLYL